MIRKHDPIVMNNVILYLKPTFKNKVHQKCHYTLIFTENIYNQKSEDKNLIPGLSIKAQVCCQVCVLGAQSSLIIVLHGQFILFNSSENSYIAFSLYSKIVWCEGAWWGQCCGQCPGPQWSQSEAQSSPPLRGQSAPHRPAMLTLARLWWVTTEVTSSTHCCYRENFLLLPILSNQSSGPCHTIGASQEK